MTAKINNRTNKYYTTIEIHKCGNNKGYGLGYGIESGDGDRLGYEGRIESGNGHGDSYGYGEGKGDAQGHGTKSGYGDGYGCSREYGLRDGYGNG